MNNFKELSHWQVVAASVCGTSHEKRNQLCQDAHHWQVLPDNILVGAIADGAGSASQGKIGAIVATETAVETICQKQVTRLWLADDERVRSLLTDALLAARKAVEAEAEACMAQPQDLASTLIVVVATTEIVAVAQIGDGVAVAKDAEGNLIALTQPHNGEYVNETTFLISANAIDTAQLTLWRNPIVSVAALTDGLQMLALNIAEGTPHQPFFSPLFQFAANQKDKTAAGEQLAAFLRSDRVTQRTDDDLTLLLAVVID
jgi:serine/threonine protein phosphatase PrpC